MSSVLLRCKKCGRKVRPRFEVSDFAKVRDLHKEVRKKRTLFVHVACECGDFIYTAKHLTKDVEKQYVIEE